MSYANQLSDEINRALDDLAMRGEHWRPVFIAHAICAAHAHGLVDDDQALFWQHCGYREVRREVTRCINGRAGDGAKTEGIQMILPGYEYVQTHYVVTRANEDIGVPVGDMTDAEIDSKITLYRTMARSCQAHADELARYKGARAAAAA